MRTSTATMWVPLAAALMFSLAACAQQSPAARQAAPPSGSNSAAPPLPGGDLEAVIETDMGSFRFEFAPGKALHHVEQFIKLAREGYYNGSAFHVAIAGGVIQGGDPLTKNPKTPRTEWGSGGFNLLASELEGAKFERGTVGGVRIPAKPDSDGSQFFVCLAAQPALDGKYTAFGHMTEGIDVVEKISRVPVSDKAHGFVENLVRIRTVTIVPKRVEPFHDATIDQLRRTVTMKTTLGTVKLKMEPDWAPNHVRNFLNLVGSGWYDGTMFHRIVKGFVAQGGTPVGRALPPGHYYADRWVRALKGEFGSGILHTRGILSMARTNDPDSATTSFFLVLAAAPHLDGKYSAFGRVVEGLDVLDAFEKEEVDGESPRRIIAIERATIDPLPPAR